MNILGLFGTGKQIIAREETGVSTVADHFAASLPVKKPTPQERWSWLEEKYPQTYAALMAIADVRPDLVFEVVEHPHTLSGQSTSFVLGDGDFQSLFDRNREKIVPGEPWPIVVGTISDPDMRVNRAGHSLGGLTDATAAAAVRQYAVYGGFVVLEQRMSPSGKMRNILTAGPAKFEQPNPAGSPRKGPPKLELVTD